MPSSGPELEYPGVVSTWLEVDEREFPLVFMRVGGLSALDEPGAREFMAAVDALLARHTRFGVVVVVRKAGVPNPMVRKLLGEFIKGRQRRLEDSVVALADVFDSKLMQHAMTAIRWLAPPTYPARVFDVEHEAVEWVRSRLREERGSWQPGPPR